MDTGMADSKNYSLKMPSAFSLGGDPRKRTGEGTEKIRCTAGFKRIFPLGFKG
jgi:hypothetical protein